MAALYYISRDGETLGPFQPESLPDLIQDGVLTPDCYVWTEGMDGWAEATDVDAVASLFDGAAPPPPSAPAAETPDRAADDPLRPEKTRDPGSDSGDSPGAPSRPGEVPAETPDTAPRAAAGQPVPDQPISSAGALDRAVPSRQAAAFESIDESAFRPSLLDCILDGLALWFRNLFGFLFAHGALILGGLVLYGAVTGRFLPTVPGWALCLAALVLGNLMLGGYWLMLLRLARGERGAFSGFFAGFTRPLALTVLLIGLGVVLTLVYWFFYGIALLVAELPADQSAWVALVPLIILKPLLVYAPFVIMDQRTGGFDGLGIGRKVAYSNGYFWTFALLILATLILAMGLAPGIALEWIGLEMLQDLLTREYAEFALPVARLVTLIGGLFAYAVTTAMFAFAYLGWAEAPVITSGRP